MNTLSECGEVFTDIPGKSNVIEHKIELIDTSPIRSWLYPLQYALRENLKKEIQDKLNLEIIRWSKSSFGFPMVIM